MRNTYPKRIFVYILGMFIMAMGVVFSINSGLGVSPVNSLPYVVHYVSGASLFICVTLIFAFYVLLQIIILRRKFKWKNLTQLIFSTIFGFFANFLADLLAPLTIPTYAGKLVMLAISIVLISIGLFLYLQADIVPMPMEGLTLTIAERMGKPFHIIKIIVDIASVAVGVLISLVATGRLNGIREGTIIAAILVGRVTGWITPPLKGKVRRFCFGPECEPSPEDESEEILEDLEK